MAMFRRFPVGLTLAFSVLLLLTVFLLLRLLPEPETMINISAQSETLAFRVANPAAVTLELQGAFLVPAQSDEDLFSDEAGTLPSRCVDGVFKTTLDSVVRYRRGSDGVVTVGIEQVDGATPVFLVSGPAREIVELRPDSQIVLDPRASSACPSVLPSALPIWGAAEMGHEGSISATALDPPGFLIEGTATIFARARESLFGVIKFPPALYKAGEIELPPGGRVVEEVPATPALGGSAWIGAARIPNLGASVDQFNTRDSGFDIRVSTNAKALHLYRSGTQGRDTLSVDLFSRQFKDPSLLWFQVWLGISFVIFQVAVSIVSLKQGA